MKGNWDVIEVQISETINKPVSFLKQTSLSGGCINQTWRVEDSNQHCWFIKTNKPNRLDMFIAESEGLNEIIGSHSIRCPKSICYGVNADFSYLVLEYVPLSSLSNQYLAGEQLAKMHLKQADSFGWYRDNTIGSTPQINKQDDSWLNFWKNNRLLYQLALARKKGYPLKAYEKGLKLAENLHYFFQDYDVKPSLLHGDLWSGNIAANDSGNPVIYDPAVYYGDRETDIAMTELFGGFSHAFYSAYNAHYALDQNYKKRKRLYNLYHILNHFNLFGGGYASQSEQITNHLLCEIN